MSVIDTMVWCPNHGPLAEAFADLGGAVAEPHRNRKPGRGTHVAAAKTKQASP